jgi:hypothetical protein
VVTDEGYARQGADLPDLLHAIQSCCIIDPLTVTQL